MNVSFPLSLKVAIWLLLNLLLLAAAAIGFLVSQGGLSWDSLVSGVPGERIHALASVVAGEVAVAPPQVRDSVLERFSKAYGAEFLLVRNRQSGLIGPPRELPDLVRQRVDEGPPGPLRRSGAMDASLPAPAADDDRPPPGPGPGQRPLGRGRFLVHAGQPAEWWIGLRVPAVDGGGRPAPGTLLIHTPSFWTVILLLNLESWLLVAAAVLVLSILFWLPLVRSISRHLRALTFATEQIAEGKFETRVDTHRRDELGRLGEAVNTMAARLDTLVNGQKRFLGDVAHELGSPLGRLQVATEILEDRAPPALREQVGDVREEVQHMADLVNELLAFTKAGLRARDAELVPVPLDPLFAKVAAREDPNGRVLRPALVPGLSVLADEPLLGRALGNLLRNALRYAGEGGPITLSAESQRDTVVLWIDDHGPGVPAASLARLGEPFYRPEFARTRETGGVGLGLAIVKSAIAACGGTVTFSNRAPRGFRAEIRLRRPPTA